MYPLTNTEDQAFFQLIARNGYKEFLGKKKNGRHSNTWTRIASIERFQEQQNLERQH